MLFYRHLLKMKAAQNINIVFVAHCKQIKHENKDQEKEKKVLRRVERTASYKYISSFQKFYQEKHKVYCLPLNIDPQIRTEF